MSMKTHSTEQEPGLPKLASILVIDPKRELRKHIAGMLTESGDPSRLVLIGPETTLYYFEGLEDLPLLSKIRKLDVIAPAAWTNPEGNASTWIANAKAFVEKIVRFDALTREKGVCALRVVLEHLDPQDSQPTYFAVVQQILNYARASTDNLRQANLEIQQQARQCGIPEREASFFQSFLASGDLIEQFNYFCLEADIFLNAVANPDVTKMVDFCPFGPESRTAIKVLPLVEEGKIIVFSPSVLSDATVTIVGKCLKAKFFQSVFSRRDKERPVGYVCDEFQRFITADEDSGEQSFLDRCRAYRVVCVLATQSVASIQYALGNSSSAKSAIDIILNNTGNKILMRNTDESTAGKLRSLLPASPHGGPHIAEIRPVTTLNCGEAYYFLCNGDWGREKITLPAKKLA